MSGGAAQPSQVLLVGAVTLDRFGDEWRPGGAPLYAARALAALGLRARVLTIAGPDADLEVLAGHELEVVAAEASLRFEHEPAGDSRRLRLAARPARALTAGDLPAGWGDAGVLVLGPLLPDDVDVASFLGVATGLVGLLAQGLQRRVRADGGVAMERAPSGALLEALQAESHARTTVFLSSEEVAGWPREVLSALASSCARVVVTRGAAGAEVHRGGAAPLAVAAAPAQAVDTTGGGDAFAAAFMAALAGGAGDAAAGALAARVAAATVERVGPAEVPAIAAPVDGVVEVEAGDAAVAQ